MAINKVSITLDAKDNASDTINRLNRLLDTTGRNAASIGTNGRSAFSGLTGAITGSMVQLQLLNTAVGVVGNAFGSLVGRFQEAATFQNQTLTSAGSWMALTGQSFDEATGYLQEFSKEMSIVANNLPGNTADYVAFGKGITDNLIPAFKDLNGALDTSTFDEYLKDITTSAGFLAANSGVDIGNAAQGISKALQGRSLSELEGIDFFEENPAVTSLIKEEADKLGKSLEDLTDRQRAEVIRNALQRATPPEVIEAAKSSVPGLIQGFMGSLFDPYSGVFGLLKDLDPVMEGDQSAFEAFRLALKSLLGEGGLVETISDILGDLGFNADEPMRNLRENFIWLRNQIQAVDRWLEGLRDAGTFSSPLNFSLGDSISEAIDRVGGFFERVSEKFSNIDLTDEGATAAEIINSILDGISQVDWGVIASNIGEGLANVFNGGGELVEGIDKGKLVRASFDLVLAVMEGSASFLRNANLSAAGIDSRMFAPIQEQGLLPFLSRFARFIASTPLTPQGAVNNGIRTFTDRVVGFLLDNADRAKGAVVDTLTVGWQTLADGLSTLWSQGRQSIESIKDSFFDGARKLADRFTELFRQGVLFVDSLLRRIPGYQSTLGNAPIRESQSFNVQSRADGLIPGLLGAAIREAGRMPAGSDLVVANSSEAILNQAQQAAIVGLLGSRQTASGGNINITIGDVVSMVSDPNQVADMVITKIEQQLSRYNLSRVTAVAT